MTIYTKDLADVVGKLTGNTVKAKNQEVVDTIVKAIVDQVLAGNKVYLTGLGSFVTVEKKARKARNPRTGETVDVAAYKKLVFTEVKELRKMPV